MKLCREFITIVAFLLMFATVNATNVGTCQNLTAGNTYYLLTADLVSASGICLNISANNATLDCNGYKISGGNSVGIYSNSSNTTVRNCTIRDLQIGLELNNITNGSFTNNFFANNTMDMNFADINSSNNFVANNFGGTMMGFIAQASNLLVLQTALSPPSSTFANASNYISILTTDLAPWIYLNFSYDSTNISESTLLLWSYSGGTWGTVYSVQDTTNDNFITNTSTFGTYAILGCPTSRAYYWGGACYTYIQLTVSEEPPNYIIGDVVTLFASLADPTVNATALFLYYLDANGTTYLNQSLLYSPATSEWFGVYKLRQSSEFLQVVAFDNTSGNNTVMGYGSFTLSEKPAYSWMDWLLIFVVIGVFVFGLIFIGKWFWGGF